MASKYISKFPIPQGYPEMLHDFSREILRLQPENILEFGYQYFKAKEEVTPFWYFRSYTLQSLFIAEHFLILNIGYWVRISTKRGSDQIQVNESVKPKNHWEANGKIDTTCGATPWSNPTFKIRSQNS